MTLQELNRGCSVDAQGAFILVMTDNKQTKALADQERQRRRDVAIRNITERKYSKVIAQSKAPVIIITEDKAESYGALYKRLNDALPNIPVIFENQVAQQKFQKSQFCIMNEFNHRTVGYFTRSDGFEPRGFCDEMKKSDCVIILGSPQKDLAKALKGNGDYITSDQVNLSLIETMKRNTDGWAYWNKDINQIRPSVF